MTAALADRVASALSRDLDPEVANLARRIGEEAGARAVLFYGSNLRTGELEGVLDFYVLLDGPQRERIWPRVSYREFASARGTLRAKIATLSLVQFGEATRGTSLDTTIWARFVQPSALAWVRDEASRAETIAALADAAVTAATLAAALGPDEGLADDYWRALFRATYQAEFRVEAPGREDSILAVNRSHFDGLLPLAWDRAGIPFGQHEGVLTPRLDPARRRSTLRWWQRRKRMGKALNILRLAKATTTFEGAAEYGAWKLERHTGLRLEVTPFRASHPLLAMPGAAWELWRARRARQRGQR